MADLVAALAVAHGAGACDSTVVLATSESTVVRQFYRDQSRGRLEVKQHNNLLPKRLTHHTHYRDVMKTAKFKTTRQKIFYLCLKEKNMYQIKEYDIQNIMSFVFYLK